MPDTVTQTENFVKEKEEKVARKIEQQDEPALENKRDS